MKLGIAAKKQRTNTPDLNSKDMKATKRQSKRGSNLKNTEQLHTE